MAALEDLQDSTGYQRQPFLKRLLPRQVRQIASFAVPQMRLSGLSIMDLA